MARTKQISRQVADKPAAKEHDDASDGFPSANFEPIAKRWVSNDLQILRSGMFADAEIVCQGDATPRKVHRNILAGRSAWFQKAFFGNFKEAEKGKVNLQETPWRVDLMLYFFYTGGIDVDDETLTSGHDPMKISIELLRLADFFRSDSMQAYGKWLLLSHLEKVLNSICDTGVSAGETKARFQQMKDFPQQFCGAVVNAFDKARPVKAGPVKAAQGILADFAFAARTHMFKQKEFVRLIADMVVPEFGNLLLAAQVTGSVSKAFDSNNTYKKWQKWQVTPRSAPSRKTPTKIKPKICLSGDSESSVSGDSSEPSD